MPSHCYLKQIVLQARPLTVTRWRICYEFCNRLQMSSQFMAWFSSSWPGEACVGAPWGNGRSCLPDAWTPCPICKERQRSPWFLSHQELVNFSLIFCSVIDFVMFRNSIQRLYVFSTNKCLTLEELNVNLYSGNTDTRKDRRVSTGPWLRSQTMRPQKQVLKSR